MTEDGLGGMSTLYASRRGGLIGTSPGGKEGKKKGTQGKEKVVDQKYDIRKLAENTQETPGENVKNIYPRKLPRQKLLALARREGKEQHGCFTAGHLGLHATAVDRRIWHVRETERNFSTSRHHPCLGKSIQPFIHRLYVYVWVGEEITPQTKIKVKLVQFFLPPPPLPQKKPR